MTPFLFQPCNRLNHLAWLTHNLLDYYSQKLKLFESNPINLELDRLLRFLHRCHIKILTVDIASNQLTVAIGDAVTRAFGAICAGIYRWV